MTYYFAASGGATEDVQNGLPGTAPEPWLVGVLDPYDATRFGPITMSLTQADHRLRGLLRGVLRSIVVTARGVSPRIVSRATGRQRTARPPSTASSWRPRSGCRAPGHCFAVTTSMATVAAGWDRACARPGRLSVLPRGAHRADRADRLHRPAARLDGRRHGRPGRGERTDRNDRRRTTGSSGTGGSHVGGAVGPPG